MRESDQPAPSPGAPCRTITHAVAGLSLAAILGYVLLTWLGGPAAETLINIALTGVGILGGMAVPQRTGDA